MRGVMICATRPRVEAGARCDVCGTAVSSAWMPEVHEPGRPARVFCHDCLGAMLLVVHRPGLVLSMDSIDDRMAARDWIGKPAAHGLMPRGRARDRARSFTDGEGRL
jgi:hypothetical protein